MVSESLLISGFNGNHTLPQVIKCGVPQGSILGPLLFLLYVNDIANVSSVLFMIFFADDINIFVQGKNISEMFNIMNGELQKPAEWMCINKLSLNVKKDPSIWYLVWKEVLNLRNKLY